MADFKTTLERLARREIEVDAVAANLDKLLGKRPQAAVAVIDQLRQALTADVIDAETYAQLKSHVARHLEVAPAQDNEQTVFAGPDDDDDDDDVFDITGGGSADEVTKLFSLVGPDPPHGVDGTMIAAPTTAPNSAVDFDPSSDPGSATSSSWPTGNSQTSTGWWRSAGGANSTAQLGPGAVLRGRFQLDRVLGVGGMGSVYLGSDLIKVRAKDKQPRVALKVLNEDFKQHPDSFIALQREASRQQRLAHPNIATVYDFDQTEDGLAFLVMELLEGQALNDYIKKVVKPKGGLPFEQALPMVQGLGNALVYAHERNIVHSDFKPGNCFVTQDGTMKVLDFGIARAVKAPGAAEGETTIFDPGKLGALTPAYASTEMLEGEEPDPRDDIYALACVTYELLTGKHPFNKIPANKARDSGLAPEPIKTITRKQWRGLERGLAFKREDRSQSTAEFLQEFEGATSAWKNPLVMLPAALALIVLAGFFPAKNYLEEQDIQARIAQAQTGDPAQIEMVLDELPPNDQDSSRRDRILTEAKDQILNYFESNARRLMDISAGNFDFAGASTLVRRARAYAVYADSSKLLELERDIDESRNRLLAEQFDRFNTALENGNLLAVDGEDDIFDAMAVVRRIDPQHAMLTDPRIPGAFANAVDAALENEDYDFADELGRTGIGVLPENAYLKDLTDKVAGAKDRAETSGRILRAIANIEGAIASGDGLAAYVDVGSSVADLAKVDPGNELLDKLRSEIEPLARADVAQLEKTRAWGRSALMRGDYNGLLRGLGLHAINARAGALGAEFDAVVSEARNAVTAAVAADKLAPEATTRLAALAAIAPGSPRTSNARDQIARAYLGNAQRARIAQDFTSAAQALAQAKAVRPSTALLTLVEAEEDRMAAAQAADATQRASAEAAALASFDTDYPDYIDQIRTLDRDPDAYAASFARLDQLQALAPGDARLEQARQALADAVTRGALRMGEDGQWDTAVDITRRALVIMPRSAELGASLVALEQTRKQALLKQQAQLVADSKQAIETLLEDPTADRDWRANVRQKMETVVALGEPDDPWLGDYALRIARVYIERANAMRQDQRFAEGANLLADAERFAPAAPGLASERAALTAATDAFEREQAEQSRVARINGLKQTFESQARANDVANAAKTLETLRTQLSGQSDTFVGKEAPRMLAGAYYKLATQRAAASDYGAALRFAKACVELQGGRLECSNAVRDYTLNGNQQDLQKTFERGGDFDLTEVLAKIAEVQALDPGVFSVAESRWAGSVASRLEALKESAGTGANDIIDKAKNVFTGNQVIAAIAPVTLRVAPSAYAAQVIAAMDKAELGKARDLLKHANQSEADHPDIVRLKARYNGRVKEAKRLHDLYREQYTNKDYDGALATIEQALTVWSDSATFKKAYSEIISAMDSGGTTTPPPLAPTDPCEPKLAGHGKRKKGTCFYFVSSNLRGPLMVVVPAGEEFTRPFAISKFEIAVADYNRYCKLSGACTVQRGQEGAQPITGITLDDARAYAKWLSERTGLHYRLPTDAEWVYAANAGGDQPKKDFNCRVEQGGQLLKGQGTMGVNTGKANGWGLYNYVGNVQEWVTTADGIAARGGAFDDTFSKCEIQLQKAHDGSADRSTGFRVLLELDTG